MSIFLVYALITLAIAGGIFILLGKSLGHTGLRRLGISVIIVALVSLALLFAAHAWELHNSSS